MFLSFVFVHLCCRLSTRLHLVILHLVKQKRPLLRFYFVIFHFAVYFYKYICCKLILLNFKIILGLFLVENIVSLFIFLSLNNFVLIALVLQMEGIPSKARNLQMSLLMAKLYRNSRHNRGAVACYKECLRFPCSSFIIFFLLWLHSMTLSSY